MSGLFHLNGDCVESADGLVNSCRELKIGKYKELFKSLCKVFLGDKRKPNAYFMSILTI